MIRKNDVAEFVGQIIDVFEDFLEDRQIQVKNPEKEDDPVVANLYGCDYGEIQSGIEAVLTNWGVIKRE